MAESTASPMGIVLVQTADAYGAPLLRSALTARPQLEIVAEVTTTLQAVAAAGRFRPGVLVMDIGFQDLAGHGVLRSVRSVSPQTRIVVHAHAADVDEAPGTQRWIARLVEVVADPVRSAPLVARLVLPEEPRNVPVARGFLSELLGQWDLQGLVASAALVASELVANATQHVRGPCALELTHRDDVLRVAVADRGPGMPDLRVLGALSERGRGLQIVSAYASAWGVDRLECGGKLVWADLGGLAMEEP
jgi:anti-sigma regulatory factor (Ser/Thr protein kinase)